MASPQPSNPLDRYSLPTAMSSSRRRGGGGSAASPSSPSAPITEQLPLVTSPNTSEKRYFRTTEEALEQMQDVLRRRQERRNNQHVGLGVVAGSSSQGRPFDPLAGQRAIADNSVYSARSTGKGGGGAVALIGQKKTEMYNHRHQDDFARRNLHGLTASLSLRTEQYLADPSPIARTSGDETSTRKQTSTSSPAAAHESKQQQQLVMEKSSQTTTSTTTNAADATALHAAQRSLVFSDGLGGGNTSPGDPQVVPNQAPSPVMLVDERRQHKQKPSAAAAAAASTYVPHPFPHQQQEQNMVITKKASSARDAKAVVPQSQQRQQQNVHPSNLTTAPLGTSIGDADDTADRLFATLSMLDQALKLKKYELEHQKLSLLSGTGGRGGREREGDDASLARASGSFSIPAAGDDGGKAFLPPPPVLSSLNAGLTQPTNSARSVSRRAAASPSPATRHHRDPIQINQDRGAGGGDDGRPKSPSPTIVEAPPPRSAMAVEAPRLSTARHHSMEQSGDGADLLGGRRSSSEGNKSTPGSFGSSSGNLQPPAPPQLDGSPTTQLPSSSASPPERVNRRRGPSHDLQPVAAVPLLQSSHRLLLRASASRKSSTSSKKNQPSTPKHQSSSNGGDDIGSSSSSIAATPLQPQAPHILADLRCRSPIVHAAAMTF